MSATRLDVAGVRARFTALQRRLAFFDGPGGTQCPDEVIDANLAPAAVTSQESAPLLSVRVGSTLDEVSRRLIEATLAECGSKRKAADMLGISLKTLYNRLIEYGAAEASEAQAAEAESDDEVDGVGVLGDGVSRHDGQGPTSGDGIRAGFGLPIKRAAF